MSMIPVGSRVGALLSGAGDKVMFLGYGLYVGDRPCPSMGDLDNPKIVLDDGSVAWGCECWWGSEDKIRKMLVDKTIVPCEIMRDDKGVYVCGKRKNLDDAGSSQGRAASD